MHYMPRADSLPLIVMNRPLELAAGSPETDLRAKEKLTHEPRIGFATTETLKVELAAEGKGGARSGGQALPIEVPENCMNVLESIPFVLSILHTRCWELAATQM
jgi:hypothetical protein